MTYCQLQTYRMLRVYLLWKFSRNQWLQLKDKQNIHALSVRFSAKFAIHISFGFAMLSSQKRSCILSPITTMVVLCFFIFAKADFVKVECFYAVIHLDTLAHDFVRLFSGRLLLALDHTNSGIIYRDLKLDHSHGPDWSYRTYWFRLQRKRYRCAPVS